MKATAYLVLNENTLGYITPDEPTTFGVLAGKPQLGGHNWINGPVALTTLDKTREATLEDFAFYRVSPEGHIA